MLYQSAVLSLIIQSLVAIIDIYGLNIHIPKEKIIFRQLLQMDLTVQIVEMIFYVWLIYNFANIENITPHRYYDWIITTPVLLLTLMAYLSSGQYSGILEFMKTHSSDITKVLVANMLMLVFGLLGELSVLPYIIAIILGFIPFLYYYYIIYRKYIYNQNTTKDKKALYWFFFIIWILYGVAAFFPYILKNTAYNILDLFAKNLFGVFLVYIIWTYRVQK